MPESLIQDIIIVIIIILSMPSWLLMAYSASNERHECNFRWERYCIFPTTTCKFYLRIIKIIMSTEYSLTIILALIMSFYWPLKITVLSNKNLWKNAYLICSISNKFHVPLNIYTLYIHNSIRSLPKPSENIFHCANRAHNKSIIID